ncbi:MAG: hypothetical protein M3Y49_04740 [Actinomycetota bacterium]|nr:hypothetical protein [Actinomycetota bacterium]
MVQIETPEDPSFEKWLRSALDQTPLPAELGVTREDVTTSGRRILRRRQVVRRGLIGLAAAAAVGVSVPLLNDTLTPGHHDTTGRVVAAGSCAATLVIDATGTQRLLIVSAPHTGKVDIMFFSSADCEQSPSQRPAATDSVSSPAPGRAAEGQVSGMPFYLVNGPATTATINGLAATVVRSLGQQSVIWPNQSVARSTQHESTTIIWTIGKITYAQKVAPHTATTPP